MVDPCLVPEPTVFVLYGATGDLAHRLVLPAFFRLAKEGFLPENWRLVGNGRGDVAHEDFRARVHASLEEFGPKPEDGPWDDFSSRLLFAGGGFDSDNPGSLLEVLSEAVAAGADLLVIGRAVTAAPDREAAAASLAASVQWPLSR